MDYNFLLVFVGLSLINVIASTARSILTIKGNKWVASLISGGYFAFYNVMVIYMVADFSLLWKCVITFFCNVIGTLIVKYVEESLRKDKLWKVEATISPVYSEDVIRYCTENNISYNYVDIQKYILFNFYCPTQEESAKVKKLCDLYNAKYFVAESKTLI